MRLQIFYIFLIIMLVFNCQDSGDDKNNKKEELNYSANWFFDSSYWERDHNNI